MEIIQANPDKQWNWERISKHPNITWEIIQANPYYPWDWEYVSQNTNITWEFIQANPDKEWSWLWISLNPMSREKQRWINQQRLRHIKAFKSKDIGGITVVTPYIDWLNYVYYDYIGLK